ncbi:hypothetical protein PM10SUCC1_26530 [Propionigenium maris DSM 9537]|uniref:HTH tetR-type domain-containing protein n=1 Tax=Propionigenium maris DSM 9537 TaxID=1123000 RepID=A0A9W6LNQ3_9FUSO|nr:TetR/AcrR family transcriptional regulator [Propionigenium maris]GLI57139.1 hypothetical protein PM10SUCC1_26530 [Propionigenium maris DSM 9537]
MNINTRDKLIQAAMELVNTFGLHNTPTSKIAKKAGFSEGTIYKHFSSKDEFLMEVYLKIKSDLDKEIFRGTKDIKDPLEKCRRVYSNYLDYFLANEDQLKYYLQFTNSTYMNQVINERGKRELENLMQYIDENIKSGFFKDRPISFYHAFANTPIVEIARLATTGDLILTKEMREEVISSLMSLILAAE